MKLTIQYYFPTKAANNLVRQFDIDVESWMVKPTRVRDFLARLRTEHLQDLTLPSHLVLVLKGVSLQEDQYLDSYRVEEGDKLYLVQVQAQVDVIMLVKPSKGPQEGEKRVSLKFPTEGICANAVRDALVLKDEPHETLEHRLLYQGRILSDYEIIPCSNQNVPTLHLQTGRVVYVEGKHSTPIPFFLLLHQTVDHLQEMMQAKHKLIYGDEVFTDHKLKNFMSNESVVKFHLFISMRIVILVERGEDNVHSFVLNVEPSYTIKQVKFLIQSTDKRIGNFYLEFQGKELTCDNNTLEFYNIQSDSVLLCKRYWQVFIKGASGKALCVRATPKQAVLDFRHEYARSDGGLCANLCELMCLSKLLVHGPGNTFADYKVLRNESTIHALCSGKGWSICQNCSLGIVPCIGTLE